MNDASPTPAVRFTGGDLFATDSLYARLRSRRRPREKLRGYFADLGAATAGAERFALVRTAALAREREPGVAALALRVDDPACELPAPKVRLAFRPGKTPRLVCAVAPSAGAPRGGSCRLLVLAPEVLEMLCGPLDGADVLVVRERLARLLRGDSSLPVARLAGILSAVPEIEGAVGADGACAFPDIDLPDEAAKVTAFPRGTLALVLICPEDAP